MSRAPGAREGLGSAFNDISHKQQKDVYGGEGGSEPTPSTSSGSGGGGGSGGGNGAARPHATHLQAPPTRQGGDARISRTPSENAYPIYRNEQASCEDDLDDDANYDADLQEALYLGEIAFPPDPSKVQVKNGFVHFDVPWGSTSSMALPPVDENRWATAPDRLLEKSFQTRPVTMAEKHARGDCQPCGYFVYKEDGCRWGDSCQYCHLCSRGEIKKRKKATAKRKKAEAAAHASASGTDDAQANGST
eukprot:TRINITY_DN7628_c0_g3_i2.p1 TRINITY_DN7628_c0_g3~~TRINITY_DN7628_c0_g3_i2.p1  ORF type:complete len:248 (-),score=43.08 TRINITY_DN7628_c0_g3_i2:194-937(-)